MENKTSLKRFTQDELKNADRLAEMNLKWSPYNFYIPFNSI